MISRSFSLFKMNHLWKRIPCCKKDLQLIPTLSGGQSFRWKKSGENEWIGVFGDSVWMLSQSDEHLLYKRFALSPSIESNQKSLNSKKKKRADSESVEDEIILRSYFRLDVDLNKYYECWSKADPHFKESSEKFYGIRILNQDIVETLFSFICSSNNNITRISSMIEKMCQKYGTFITKIDDIEYFTFPKFEKLTSPSVESELREAGFGYRAKFIHKSACLIQEFGGLSWLDKLKSLPYEESKNELMKLQGIGAKVADCICLMALGHLKAIPVDTHIFQVASQLYLPHLKSCKSVTNKVYNEIGDFFREMYGSYAGWAHTILFCSDLKRFQENSAEKRKKKRKLS